MYVNWIFKAHLFWESLPTPWSWWSWQRGNCLLMGEWIPKYSGQQWCSPWTAHRCPVHWALHWLGMNSERTNLCYKFQECWKHLSSVPGSLLPRGFLMSILHSGTSLWGAAISAATSKLGQSYSTVLTPSTQVIQPHRGADTPVLYLQRI